LSRHTIAQIGRLYRQRRRIGKWKLGKEKVRSDEYRVMRKEKRKGFKGKVSMMMFEL
jgi:hypothetical protein